MQAEIIGGKGNNMNKIINGKKYSTDTAKAIGNGGNDFPTSDFHYLSETLYKKYTGEYFLYGEGGPMTIYARCVGDNSYGYGKNITPLSAKEARQWAEENLSYNDYVKEFGEPEE